MTFKNSVLINIKKNPGIDYSDLLSRLSLQYKNPSSANSALNRAIKNMVSFGLIKREGSKLFVTDKGSASITVEMKDKLILRLNEEMKKSFPNPEEVIQYLIILHQRSLQDSDLINTARQNATFTIRDLELYRKRIFERRRFLKKMNLLIKQNIENLKELDFNDSLEFVFDGAFVSRVVGFSANDKLVVETNDESLISKVPVHWLKQNTITVEKESISLLLQLLLSVPSLKATLYFSGVKAILFSGKITCFGSYKTLSNFVNFSAQISSDINLTKPVSSENNTIIP
jgi:hypothetical protein